MWRDHARFFEIDLEETQDAPRVRDHGPLRIVLFRRAAKLRSHAVKHLTNLTQYETTWKRISGVDIELIRRCIADLEKAGCPFFKFSPENPPCDDGREGCRLFDRCPASVKQLEQAYCNALVQCLMEGGQVPRYAYYYCDNEQAHMFCLMPDAPLVLKASLLPEETETYNLMTCYGSEGVSFTEMRDIQVEKIRNEARAKNTDLCSLAGWGLEQARSDQAREHAKGRESAKKKRRLKKRHKRGGGNWKQYLNEYEDLYQ
ncbi:hypothetical protein [Desulfatibacillum aliphaticivorans]|uniref:Uncharacterized protein n=1 Tax=Desulfatibacillum aliphaticivorans TaxID=218208 RepID=B8FC80_DESAL|nr:hypothetical protein [Desulfatibacillum aliphaticivorans]ACL05498.1 hypothetical protein Dalk_3812 [Desulfatibacillum aliphaticivorans]